MKILMLVLFFIFFSCNNIKYIDRNNISNNEVQNKFNISSFNKRFSENEKWQKSEFILNDGTFIQEGDLENYYYQYIQDPTTLYAVSQEYYKNGNLKERGYIFAGNIQIGIWKTYDKKGVLVNEIDEDIKFENYNYNDVIKFLKEKKITKNIQDLKTIEINFDEDKKEWYINKKKMFDKKEICKDCAIGLMDKYVIDAKNRIILEEKLDIKIYQDFDDVSN